MKLKMLSALAFAAYALSATPASAYVIAVNYQAIVSFAQGTTANTGLTNGQTVSGMFTFETATSRVLSSMLAGFSAPATGDSTAAVTPGRTTAVFRLGTNAILPGQPNESVTVGLSALSTFSGTNAVSLLTDPTLPGQVDLSGDPLFGSTANYLRSNAGATNNTAVYASIQSLRVTSVPEPASMTVIGVALAGLAMIRRRRA